MDALAFVATRFVRPSLRPIIFCLLIVMTLPVTLVQPAHASGSVPPQAITTYLCRNGTACTAGQTMQSYCDYFTGTVGSSVFHEATGDAADYFRLYFSCLIAD